MYIKVYLKENFEVYFKVYLVSKCIVPYLWNRRYSNWKKGGWWRGGRQRGSSSVLQKYSCTEIQKIKIYRNQKIQKFKRKDTENYTNKGEREKYENTEKVWVVVETKWGELFCSSSLRSKRLSTAQWTATSYTWTPLTTQFQIKHFSSLFHDKLQPLI